MWGNDIAGRTALRRLAGIVVGAMTLFSLAAVPIASAGATGTTTNTLHAGSELAPRNALVSKNGRYRFVMQSDGNLVLYEGPLVKWDSATGGHPGAHANLQRDGNFVIYDRSKVLFETETNGEGGPSSTLVVQNDGNVVLYNGTKPLWWTYHPYPILQYGSTGSAVVTLQRELASLKYWVGTRDGIFGDSTEQAVWALQKAAGISPSGVVGPSTWRALDRGVEPKFRHQSGNLIEVNLNVDLLMVIKNGKLWAVLNTSTGGGYTYYEGGSAAVAITPQGVFHIFSAIDGSDTDPLGTLWRPRFFYEGYAIHGDGYVPPFPVSHGCVRVSDEAIDWIWADDVAPIGEEVWIFRGA